jgi:spore coat protein U-like protein
VSPRSYEIFTDKKNVKNAKLNLTLLVAVSCLLAGSVASRASTATSTFTVTATVPTACTINAGPMNFGNYASGSALQVTATSTITANCALLTAYTVALSKGSATSFSPRTMTMTSGGTTYTLNYNLYTNVANTSIWGDGTNGTSTVAGVGSGAPQNLTVYGTIPAGQSIPVGTYTDTIVATITF